MTKKESTLHHTTSSPNISPAMSLGSSIAKRPLKPRLHTRPYRLQGEIFLNSALVRDVPDKPDGSIVRAFEVIKLHGEKQILTVLCSSDEEKNLWVQVLKSRIDSFLLKAKEREEKKEKEEREKREREIAFLKKESMMPQTPEEIEAYKEMMRKRYEDNETTGANEKVQSKSGSLILPTQKEDGNSQEVRPLGASSRSQLKVKRSFASSYHSSNRLLDKIEKNNTFVAKVMKTAK